MCTLSSKGNEKDGGIKKKKRGRKEKEGRKKKEGEKENFRRRIKVCVNKYIEYHRRLTSKQTVMISSSIPDLLFVCMYIVQIPNTKKKYNLI
jgi:hypothetical protein